MEELIELEEPQQIIKTLNSPTYTSKYTIEYKFKEIKIEPEKIIYVAIPDKYTTLELTWLGFSHRQKGTNNNTWDNRPGQTTALVYSKAYPGDEFRYWAGLHIVRWVQNLLKIQNGLIMMLFMSGNVKVIKAYIQTRRALIQCMQMSLKYKILVQITSI
tara:strand:+ start:178 stop:654 length:477 start_codon:yes stop_codon:yes gene_type:complete